jgi:hypothetical protein
MAWKLKLTDEWADKLHFTVRGVLFVNAILISLSSVYVVAKLLWFAVALLNRTIFAHPW